MKRTRNIRRWSLMLALTGALSTTGCATSSPFNGWFGGASSATVDRNAGDEAYPATSSSSSTETPLPSEQSLARDALGNSTSTWGQMWQGVSNALTIQPKVIPAKDAVRLSSRPEKIEADLYVKAARLYESRQDHQGAATQYQRALEINPDNLAALIGWARLHDRGGEFEGAARLYRQAITAHPESALALNDFGLCCARHGALSQSVEALQQAVQLQPKRVLYRNNLAKVLVNAGESQEALEHLSAVHPAGAAHFNLAFLLHESGDVEAARHHLARATQADPTLEIAAEMLEELDQQVAQGLPAAPSPPKQQSTFSFTSIPTQPTNLPALENATSTDPPQYRIGDEPAEEGRLPQLLPPVVELP